MQLKRLRTIVLLSTNNLANVVPQFVSFQLLRSLDAERPLVRSYAERWNEGALSSAWEQSFYFRLKLG